MSPHAPHERLHRRFAARDARPQPNPNPNPEPEPVQTVTSIVYYTASKTFSGDIGGYATPGLSSTASSTSSQSSAAQTSDSIAADTSSSDSQSSTFDTTSLPTAIPSPSTTDSNSIAILAASGSITVASSKSSTATGTSSAASATTSSTSTSAGMSTAGKAGMVVGILLLIGAVLAMVLFCFKRRKQAQKERLANDEKHEFQAVQQPVVRSPSARNTPAPRLSLRPVTQFIPNLIEKRQSRGNNALMTPPTNPSPAWDRPLTGQSNNRENPFGNHAETIDSANASGPTVVQDTTSRGEIIPVAAAGAAAGAVTGATIGLARGASKRANAPPRMDFTTSGPFMGPPSPAPTEFSMHSESGSVTPVQTATGVAIAAAGGPSNSAVHRVQLDFKPSMEDELELRAGQLIRMLHEYDDGWALCIRLDRSQQGVVPRTCLSTRPVKPRPQQNGPRGPPPPGMRVPQAMQPGRPMTPNGQQRAMSPQQQRPMTPSQQQRAMTPNGGEQFPLTPSQARSMSPQQSRPMSPAQVPLPSSPSTPGGRDRSPSVAQQSGRKSPPGPSPMNNMAFIAGGSPPTSAPIRKPVPGQAL